MIGEWAIIREAEYLAWSPYVTGGGEIPNCFPEYMHTGVREYLELGRPQGGYLMSLVEGRLFDASCSADADNFRDFAWQAKWFAQMAPADAFGSPEKVAAWIESGGLVGRAR